MKVLNNISIWQDKIPGVLENSWLRAKIFKPALYTVEGMGNAVASQLQKSHYGFTSKPARFLGNMIMDMGVMSSVSIFFAAWSFGIAPLSIFAGLGLASVVGLKTYNTLFVKPEEQTPEILNKKSSFERFFKRPNGSYTLSAFVSFGTCLGLITAAALGAVPALGASALVTSKFLSTTFFGTLFSISNNIKAAKIDHDHGYQVKPLSILSKLDPSWSERLAIWGNLARNFVAGPVIGLLSLPVMREALKFTRRYKENELQGKPSFTDTHLSSAYGWTKPKSDSGMARTLSGLSGAFTAVAAATVIGDYRLAVALAYPAFTNIVLGGQSHKAYESRLNREFKLANDNTIKDLQLVAVKTKQPRSSDNPAYVPHTRL